MKISRGSDGTAKLWSAKDGLFVLNPNKYDDWVNGTMFSKHESIMFAYTVAGKPLTLKHGVPSRLVASGLWGYKSAKWVERHLGYWA